MSQGLRKNTSPELRGINHYLKNFQYGGASERLQLTNQSVQEEMVKSNEQLRVAASRSGGVVGSNNARAQQLGVPVEYMNN